MNCYTKQAPKLGNDYDVSFEKAVEIATEAPIDDEPSTAVTEEETPWIKPGLLVTLTGLHESYPSLDNSRALIRDVQDSFGALVSPLSSSNLPLLLVDQDNCTPLVDLEGLGPFGATERHQIIKGNVGEIGKNVRIIRKVDRNTVECTDEQGTRLVLSIDSLCLISRHS